MHTLQKGRNAMYLLYICRSVWHVHSHYTSHAKAYVLRQTVHLSASFAEKNSAAVDTSNGVCKSSGAIETTCVSQAVLLACFLRSLMW